LVTLSLALALYSWCDLSFSPPHHPSHVLPLSRARARALSLSHTHARTRTISFSLCLSVIPPPRPSHRHSLCLSLALSLIFVLSLSVCQTSPSPLSLTCSLALFCSYSHERWGAGVETQNNVRGEIGGWGRVPFNEPYAPLLSTIYDGA